MVTLNAVRMGPLMEGVVAMKTIKFATLSLALGCVLSACATEHEEAAVTFTVGCFDVGASELQGRPGVLSVQKGWRDGEEVNRVVFDPQKVSVPSMETWLKSAGTFIGSEMDQKQSH
jgi:hypothetical protein